MACACSGRTEYEMWRLSGSLAELYDDHRLSARVTMLSEIPERWLTCSAVMRTDRALADPPWGIRATAARRTSISLRVRARLNATTAGILGSAPTLV